MVLWKWYYYRIKNLNSTCDLSLQNQDPCRLGQLVFQGNYPLQNQGHSLSPSLTTTESRPNRSKEKWSYDLMQIILLQNQEPEFYNILHLISLYKIEGPYMLGKKGFRGTILYRIKVIPSYYLKTTTESRSEDLTLRGKLYYKIKGLRVSQALSLQNQLHAQKVRFCALPADCWSPCLQNQGPTKI